MPNIESWACKQRTFKFIVVNISYHSYGSSATMVCKLLTIKKHANYDQ